MSLFSTELWLNHLEAESKKINRTHEEILLNHLNPTLLKTPTVNLHEAFSTLQKKIWYRAKAAFYLLVHMFAAPFCLIATTVLWLRGLRQKNEKFEELLPESERKTVLVSGIAHVKGLHVAKALSMIGHKVIVVDSECFWFSAARFSRYVTKFYSVPNVCNAKSYDEYVAGMIEVAKKENIDWFVPVSHTKTAIADTVVKQHLTKLNVKCLVFDDPKLTEVLDDKLLFLTTCKRLGLAVPDFYHVNNVKDVYELALTRKLTNGYYFLKPLHPYSEERENFTRIPSNPVDLRKYLSKYEGQINKDTPYFVNQFVKGKEFAANAIVGRGKLKAFQVCPCSAMQIDYDVTENVKIKEWVEAFCDATKITGLICFDFIEDEMSGEVFCIECNPRLHSCVVSYNMNNGLAESIKAAIEEEALLDKPISPPKDSRHVYFAYNEIAKLALGQQSLAETMKVFASGRDALWDNDDPLPFLLMNIFQMPMMLSYAILNGRRWNITNYCLGQLR